jgi:hypothetical protein
MSNAQYDKPAKFVPGLFVLRAYVCEQNEPSGAGSLIHAETLAELKKEMSEEYESSFGDDGLDEEDKEEPEFKNKCSFSDFELGNGDNFIMADIAYLPEGFELKKRGRK